MHQIKAAWSATLAVRFHFVPLGEKKSTVCACNAVKCNICILVGSVVALLRSEKKRNINLQWNVNICHIQWHNEIYSFAHTSKFLDQNDSQMKVYVERRS